MALNFPNSPSLNQIYTDNTSGFSYQWNGTVWISFTPSSSSQIKTLDDFSASFNNSTQTFSLTSGGNAVTPPTPQSLIINLGGVIQDPTDDYSVAGSNITFSTAPANGLSFSGVALGPAVPVNTIPDGTAALPGLAVSGDPNTGIFSPGADTIAASTGGSERARIDSSGRLLVGTSTARTNFYNGVNAAQIQLEGTNYQNAAFAIVCNANSNDKGSLILAKNRGATVGSNTVVQDGDDLGSIEFQGSDGTEFVQAASIKAEVDGTPGANDMPGRLVFSVTADGPAAPPTEAMRINNAGELLIGYTADNGAYKLQVNSQIFATSATVATSDGRYKENVASLGGCLDLVKALRPVSFTWKQQQDITRTDDEGNEVLVREGHNFPEGTQVGFIAQEVQEVLTDKPWLNSVIKENVRPAVLDSEGNEMAPEEQFFGIAEGNLIAVLTNALQEAVGRIETLTDRVAALEGE